MKHALNNPNVRGGGGKKNTGHHREGRTRSVIPQHQKKENSLVLYDQKRGVGRACLSDDLKGGGGKNTRKGGGFFPSAEGGGGMGPKKKGDPPRFSEQKENTNEKDHSSLCRVQVGKKVKIPIKGILNPRCRQDLFPCRRQEKKGESERVHSINFQGWRQSGKKLMEYLIRCFLGSKKKKRSPNLKRALRKKGKS